MNEKMRLKIDSFREKAEDLYGDGKNIEEFIETLREKFKDSEKLSFISNELKYFINMFKDYESGDYKDISKEKILYILMGLIYLVTPSRLKPKVFENTLIEEIIIIGFLFKEIKTELSKYKAWKNHRDMVVVDEDYEIIQMDIKFED